MTNRMQALIRQNDELTLEIHNTRRYLEKLNLKIEVLTLEIKGHI